MKLVVEDEAGTRTIVPFTAGEITVGRTVEAGGLRLADRDVSRRHARFVQVNGLVFVEDLGSLTGTRVNGEPISGRRRLREGDLIEIGGYDLAVLPDDGLAEVAGPGAPPPLPGTKPAPAAPPGAAAPEVPAPRPDPKGDTAPARSPALLALVFLAALLVGALAGYLVGAATARL